MKGEKSLYTCSLRPTGIYGEGDELIRDFHAHAVQRGGLVIGGIPNHIEHGRVYAGNIPASNSLDDGSHILAS